jgi:sterol desaturase/sphingolipid hydroxylase (fatty acid hydroxylase superfamily)
VGKLELYTTVIFILSITILVWLEKKVPYRNGLKFLREGFWLDLAWYGLIQSYFLKIFIFDWIILPADNTFHLSAWKALSNWPLGWQVLFFLVTHDFYIYWFHRLQHASKFLWRTHEAHHSGKAIDWLAGSRSHAVEILINQTVEFAPIIFLGASPEVVPIKAMIDAVWGMYIHSNINVRSGKLQYFINGPEMHQWHHADHALVYHANFSTKFAIWDWLFKTAYLPDSKPSKYGLQYTFPKNYFLQHLFSIRRFDERRVLACKYLKWIFFPGKYCFDFCVRESGQVITRMRQLYSDRKFFNVGKVESK